MKTFAAFSKRNWRRMLLWLAALLGAVIIVMAIWFLLPLKRARFSDILPDAPFAYVTIPIDRSDEAVGAILDAVKARLAPPGRGGIRRLLVNLALPAAVPDAVMVVLASGKDGSESDVVVVARAGRLVKLMALFSRQVNKALLSGGPASALREGGQTYWFLPDDGGGFRPSAYAIVDDALVVGTGLDAVKECIRNYRAGGLADDASIGFVTRLANALERRDVVLYVGNGEGGMTRLVNAASEKFSFAAFPTMDAVAGITGTVSVNAEKISGSVLFVTKYFGAREGVHSDVKFLYGAFRRVARASGLELGGNVEDVDGDVLFQFEIGDYLSALSAPPAAEGD